MKKILTATLLIISINCFSQKKDTFPVFTSITNDMRLYGDSNTRLGGVLIENNTISIYRANKQIDTVDVICLVSDTTNIDRNYLYIADHWQPSTFPVTIKSKAILNRWYGITEYLLPKRYIVWQSVIIKKGE